MPLKSLSSTIYQSIFVCLLLVCSSFFLISSESNYESVDRAKTHYASGNSILIIINETIFPNVLDSLTVFEQDLASIGYGIITHKLDNGCLPPQIKNIINSYYIEHDISGCILIGDVKAAYTEFRTGDSQTVWISLDALDMYYMDLDGYWEIGRAHV